MSDGEQPPVDPPAEDAPPVDGEAAPEDAPAEQPPGEDGEEQKAEGEAPGEGEEGEEDSEIKKRIEENPLEMEFMKPYLDVIPERISFEGIPKINDSRSVWRLGMRKLEETFAEHIANMHLDFEDKANQYQKIQEQLEKNLDFLEGFYVDMQKAMNEKYSMIKVERDAWEVEREEIKKLHRIDAEIISLNIGGSTHIQTEKEVLTSVEGSTLAQLFSDMHALKQVNEEVFLDRDGKTFETLINYLRNDRKVFPEFVAKNDENMFYKEMHYWGIDKHNRNWQENYLKRLDKSLLNDGKEQMSPQMTQATPLEYKKKPLGGAALFDQQQFKEQTPSQEPSYMQQSQQQAYPPSDDSMVTEGDDEEIPGVALKAVKEKWSELGPLKLEDIIANSSEPIDQSLQFGQSKFNKFIIGQINAEGRVQGVGKEINHIIYEGQFKNDIYHGYGRYIYSNGNYYIGNWVDGKRSGWGKLVDKSGKMYEGMWQYSKFIGN